MARASGALAGCSRPCPSVKLSSHILPPCVDQQPHCPTNISLGMLRNYAACLLVAAVAAEGPCDILEKAGNPCVAAHSTTRALYAAYDGPLYNVTRSSDNRSINIPALEAGGFADISVHDSFCADLDCVISNVFDQSPQGNHLHQRHKLVNASQYRIHVGDGVPVYAMWFDPGFGYHQDNTTGIALGNDPESIYAVMSGTHYNGACCFDYGNSETDDTSDGAGTMEAIYFGAAHWQNNTGFGKGPWVGADLECGMYYGGANQTKVNNASLPLPFDFVTLYLRGGTDGFALKGGDATRGTLTTMWNGPRPDCAIAGTCHRHGNHTYQVSALVGRGLASDSSAHTLLSAVADEQKGSDHPGHGRGQLERRHGKVHGGVHGHGSH